MAKQKPIAAGRNPRKRGAQRMAEMGYRQVQLWFSREEFGVIDRASRKDGKKVATWIREMMLLVAAGAEYRKP